MRYKNVGTNFCRFVTIPRLTERQRNRQTDRQTENPDNTVRCITWSRTVKNELARILNMG